MLNTDILYKTHVMTTYLMIGVHTGNIVEVVYDSSDVGLEPVPFTRKDNVVIMDQKPQGQLYVKYLKQNNT